ncbi:MAG: hypothetical protein K2L70_08175 [Clostridia bacterium]|nr:hypothetical protein [Clostridia bacterium]
MSKLDKEVKKQQQIAKGIYQLSESKKAIDELAKRYDDWIDQAAELGEDEYSDQLIAEQVEMEEFSRDLSFIETRINVGAVSADVFNKLQTLPQVMNNCKSLLNGGPNLSKIGKQMSDFKKSLDSSRISLKDLRSELSPNKDYEKLFGKKSTLDPKVASKIEEKKKAREARLAAKIAASTVNPIASGVGVETASSTTDIDAITAMIDEERKKK